jgi:hypothetical protein
MREVMGGFHRERTMHAEKIKTKSAAWNPTAAHARRRIRRARA